MRRHGFTKQMATDLLGALLRQYIPMEQWAVVAAEQTRAGARCALCEDFVPLRVVVPLTGGRLVCAACARLNPEAREG